MSQLFSSIASDTDIAVIHENHWTIRNIEFQSIATNNIILIQPPGANLAIQILDVTYRFDDAGNDYSGTMQVSWSGAGTSAYDLDIIETADILRTATQGGGSNHPPVNTGVILVGTPAGGTAGKLYIAISYRVIQTTSPTSDWDRMVLTQLEEDLCFVPTSISMDTRIGIIDSVPAVDIPTLAGSTKDFCLFETSLVDQFGNGRCYLRITFPKNYNPATETPCMVSIQGAGQDGSATGYVGGLRQRLNFEGLHNQLASANVGSGAVILNSGTGNITGITVDGVQIMSGTVSFNTDLATTAIDIAANINAHTSSPNYRAEAWGNRVSIINYAGQGINSDGLVVVSSGTIDTTDIDIDANMIFVSMSNRNIFQWQTIWIKEVVLWLTKNFNIDHNRFAIVGLSYGGEATFESCLLTHEGNGDVDQTQTRNYGGIYLSHCIPYAPRRPPTTDSGTTLEFSENIHYLGIHGATDATSGFDYTGHKNWYQSGSESNWDYKFLGITGIAHTGWNPMFSYNSTWVGYTPNGDSTTIMLNIYDWVRRKPAYITRQRFWLEARHGDIRYSVDGCKAFPIDQPIYLRSLMFMYNSSGKLLWNGADASELIDFRLNSESGTTVAFTAVVTGQKEIILTPTSNLIAGQIYWIETTLYDKDGNSKVQTSTFIASTNKLILLNPHRGTTQYTTGNSTWNNIGMTSDWDIVDSANDPVSDAEWFSLSPLTGDVQIKSASGDFLSWLVDDIIRVTNHSVTANNGVYRVTRINVVNRDYDLESIETGTLTTSAPEAVDILKVGRFRSPTTFQLSAGGIGDLVASTSGLELAGGIVGEYMVLTEHSVAANNGLWKVVAVGTQLNSYDLLKKFQALPAISAGEPVKVFRCQIVKSNENPLTGELKYTDNTATGFYVLYGSEMSTTYQATRETYMYDSIPYLVNREIIANSGTQGYKSSLVFKLAPNTSYEMYTWGGHSNGSTLRSALVYFNGVLLGNYLMTPQWWHNRFEFITDEEGIAFFEWERDAISLGSAAISAFTLRKTEFNRVVFNFGGIAGTRPPVENGTVNVNLAQSVTHTDYNLGALYNNISVKTVETSTNYWGFAGSAPQNMSGNNGSISGTNLYPVSTLNHFWFVDNRSASVRIYNLPTGKTYTLKVAGVRLTGIFRQTDYTISGTTITKQNNDSDGVNALTSESQMAIFTGISPNGGDSGITLTVTNSGAQQYGYLNLIDLSIDG